MDHRKKTLRCSAGLAVLSFQTVCKDHLPDCSTDRIITLLIVLQRVPWLRNTTNSFSVSSFFKKGDIFSSFFWHLSISTINFNWYLLIHEGFLFYFISNCSPSCFPISFSLSLSSTCMHIHMLTHTCTSMQTHTYILNFPLCHEHSDNLRINILIWYYIWTYMSGCIPAFIVTG